MPSTLQAIFKKYNNGYAHPQYWEDGKVISFIDGNITSIRQNNIIIPDEEAMISISDLNYSNWVICNKFGGRPTYTQLKEINNRVK